MDDVILVIDLSHMIEIDFLLIFSFFPDYFIPGPVYGK